MKKYETIHLVKSEDLNHHGTLFAARGAAWLVEAGFAAAACEYGSTDEVVMRNLQNMSFYKPVQKGAALCLESRVVYAGTTSLVVSVLARNAMTREPYFDGYITYVTVEAGIGKKKAHGLKLDETTDEEEMELRKMAEQLMLRK